ncbi:type II toxin-antitoxin system RelE/ParE family toxin [Bosea sp. (in: a-proteobacteria)]|uniref:type II toxin-antitoxin system RelE/ParE family toxin n=1 Tax=Bosea sp. (in: a-proteobacteria) TaxID=1871050 RepID=UPI003524493A
MVRRPRLRGSGTSRGCAVADRTGKLVQSEGIGGGLAEYKINVGPGYRIYLARRGDSLIILLCGGTKQLQGADISRARDYLADYEDRLASERFQ